MAGQVVEAVCSDCGAKVEVQPPNLPQSGGALSAQDDPVKGRQILEFVCGPCWAGRRTSWTCPHCGDASFELALSCRGCGRAKPGRGPYVPDWDLIWKEERMRREEAEAIAAEWDREYPGWRSGLLKRERL